MTITDARRRHGRPALVRRAWPPMMVALNVGLGCLGALPLALGWMYLVNHPLAGLGLASPQPRGGDGGPLASAALLVVLTVPTLVVFGIINHLVAVTAGLPRRHWPLSMLAFLLSTAAVLALPELAGPLPIS